MIRLKKNIDNSYEIHLDIDKWTISMSRKFWKEAKILAKERDYPIVWTYIKPHNVKFMKHLGATFVKNTLTEDGIYKVYYFDSGVLRDASFRQ